MAKFYFRYGTMNCGKTRQLLSVWYNYHEKGKTAFIMKPLIDTKGINRVVSRDMQSKEVNYLIEEDDDIYEIIKKVLQTSQIDCILIDESQFLKEHHIIELTDIVDYLNIPVICYGLMRDFQGHLFEGSKCLLENVDKIEEIKTICECGHKATQVIRYVNGIATLEGEQIIIDGADDEVVYDSICRKCKKEILGIGRDE